MICPFIKTFNIDCIYCDNGKCDDIQTNSGNGDSWCLKIVTAGNIINRLMPGTIAYLDDLDDPVGFLQAAIINHRVLVKISTLKAAAVEFGIDYKPNDDNLTPQKYAEYGFLCGMKRALSDAKINMEKDCSKYSPNGKED